jgi:hypothetical protein
MIVLYLRYEILYFLPTLYFKDTQSLFINMFNYSFKPGLSTVQIILSPGLNVSTNKTFSLSVYVLLVNMRRDYILKGAFLFCSFNIYRLRYKYIKYFMIY